MIKTRVFPEHNYKGIYLDGKTLRIALNPKEPITELSYPEFYDVKVTSHCLGNCPWCYQDSKDVSHTDNIVKKFKEYFRYMSNNQKPFQIAFGGGEPTSHPEFCILLEECFKLGIAPNYTTNGMWINNPEPTDVDYLLEYTKKYCGGVAVSTHSHLKKYWEKVVDLYLKNDIFTNLHVIISDRKSINDFMKIYKKYHGKIKYFVLLPLSAQGRCKETIIDWDYMVKTLPEDCADIAFGANFYPYLCKTPGRFPVSLYSPEIMSKYLDLETMKIYSSSFSNKEVVLNGLKWVVKNNANLEG
jgi:organic radical activating enzyme